MLHACPDATVDICFVHGLTGDRESTWTARGQPAPWPESLLPSKLERARILSYGYDAYVVRKSVASSNRLVDHATNLLTDLTADRACCHASSRPIIFVVHSLGGLVCKQAVLLSRNHPEFHLRRVFDCTIGIAFMATPHRGSWLADWAKMPASTLGVFKSVNKSLLEILQTDNQAIELIQVNFWSMIRERQKAGHPPEVTCFVEELPLVGLGRRVVSKESATLEGYHSITIHANHRDMVRFTSAEETGFKRLLGELVRWESQVDKGAVPQEQLLSASAQSCLKSLAFPQMQSRSHEIDGAVDGTCKWLLQHDAYRSWATCDRGGLLWIKGKPGSGKSTLTKYALDNARKATRGDSALVLSFFFHGRGDELQRTPLGLFRALLHQVLAKVPSALQDLVDSFETKNRENKDWHWHGKELWYFFKSSLPRILKSRPVWLFIDALDECGEDNAVQLVEMFKALLSDLISGSEGLGECRICFSCRHYPILDLGENLFEICAEDQNMEDISTFVHDKLAGFRMRTSSTIPSLITARASGVFMWASLAVKRVLDLERGGFGLKRIEKEIYQIPPDLDALYSQLMQGMDSASLKLIQWICFALRPLTIDELQWAMVIEPDCPHQSLQAYQAEEDYVSDIDRMVRQVWALSRGLAEVSGGDRQVVQFIHQSVKDFFVEKGLPALDCCETPTKAAIRAHFRFSKICLRYLAMDEIRQSTNYSGFPFLRYATTSWVKHIMRCDGGGVPEEDILALCAWPSNALMQVWVRVYRAIDFYSKDCPRDGATLTHVLSRYHVTGLLTAMFRRVDQATEINIDARDGRGRTPLLWAAREGHEAIVELLLSTGQVDIDAKDIAGRTPLSWAARAGHEGVTRLLLSTGQVDIDAKDIARQTPLSQAAEAGHEGVTRLLLSTGQVDIDAKDSYGGTPLSRAAEAGHEGVVRLLERRA